MKHFKTFLLLLLMAALLTTMCACGKKDGGEEQTEETQQEETVEEKEENKDEDKTGSEENKEPANVVKTFDNIDNGEPGDQPLQLESVTLYDDGSVRIVPTDDVLKIAEDNDLLKDGAIYPFDDSGKIKDMYLVRFGNGGYRTIICLTEEGSLSALSANDLINDHIAIVMDYVSGRDNYVSVEQTTDEDAYGVKGITEDGEEIELDFSLDF